MVSKGVFLYQKDRKAVRLYHLTNGVITADVINAAGAIVRLLVPDKNGVLTDIILGSRDLGDYAYNNSFFGSVIGRYANRIGGGGFTLNGKRYDLQHNDMVGRPTDTNLHAGPVSWNHVVWNVIEEETDDRKITMTYRSPDMESGFPGNVDAKMVYTITDDNALSLEYFAKSDKDTYVNMSNHSSFNMAGHDSGSCLDHLFTINADYFTPVNDISVPTGELRSVKGTPFDFTSPKPLGQDIGVDDDQLRYGDGYDHNFCINGEGLRFCARVKDPKEGRVMTVYTTCPGVQLYSGNAFGWAFRTIPCKDNARYTKNGAFCLETGYYPDTPNKPQFPSCLLKAGEAYHEQTIFAFSAE
ncbi:MAG: galactose mutarotase [Clostridia bacterium]|nr:galactose mutarotase [Clostridia bacterium]